MSFQNLRVSENIYSYETMSRTTRFKREALGKSEPTNLANGNTHRRQININQILKTVSVAGRPTKARESARDNSALFYHRIVEKVAGDFPVNRPYSRYPPSLHA